MKFPNRIRELRELHRLSQRDLARRVEMSPSEIHKLEVGSRKLTQDYLERMCRVFGVGADVIMGRPANLRPNTEKGELAVIATKVDRMEGLLEELLSLVKECRGAQPASHKPAKGERAMGAPAA